MTANEFFENQLITDANSVIDKTAHKFSRSDLIKFATAYHESKVKNLDIPFVSVSLPLIEKEITDKYNDLPIKYGNER